MLVGGGPEAVELIRALRDEPANDIRICGIFDDRDDARVPALAEGLPKLGRIDELLEFGRQAEIDMLIVALPMTAEERLVQLLKTLWVLPVDIRLVGGHEQAALPPALLFLCRRGALPRPLRQADRRLGQRRQGMLRPRRRRARCSCSLAPVMLAVALAIRLDSPGPVLFRQNRYGFNNELIEVFKFRSMYVEHDGSQRRQARHPRRSARHPRRPLHPQDQPRRAAAAHQRRAQGQPVAGRPAPARAPGARLPTGSTSRSSTAISPAIA